MSVLVVIPCLNEAAHLPGLLRDLLAEPLAARIVVADGGSEDGSRAIVSELARTEPRIVLLDNPGRIQSCGVNRAIARHGADFRYFLRMDAHCRYPASFVSGLLAAAERTGATSVVVPMDTRGTGGFQSAVAAVQNSVLGNGGSPHRSAGEGRFVDHGHHALMEVAAFVAAGGYCEAMACNEDAELDRRLTDAGGTIWLEPACRIVYFPRSTPGALWRQYRGYGAGRAQNMLRHNARLKLRQAVPLAVPVALALALLAPLHAVFLLPMLGWIALSLLAGAAIGWRAGGGWALLAGVAAMIMHLGWATGFLLEVLRRPRGIAPRYGLAPKDAEAPA